MEHWIASERNQRQNPNMKTPIEFNVAIKEDEGGYLVATVLELRGCHTQAKTLGTLMKRVREVIGLCSEDKEESFKASTNVV